MDDEELKVITLRVPESLKLCIEEAAHEEHMSMNLWIIRVLREELNK